MVDFTTRSRRFCKVWGVLNIVRVVWRLERSRSDGQWRSRKKEKMTMSLLRISFLWEFTDSQTYIWSLNFCWSVNYVILWSILFYLEKIKVSVRRGRFTCFRHGCLIQEYIVDVEPFIFWETSSNHRPVCLTPHRCRNYDLRILRSRRSPMSAWSCYTTSRRATTSVSTQIPCCATDILVHLCFIHTRLFPSLLLGNIIRSAVAFGLSTVVVVGDRKFNTFGNQNTNSYIKFAHYPDLDTACSSLRNR